MFPLMHLARFSLYLVRFPRLPVWNAELFHLARFSRLP
jgi:hypothetical protein